MKLHIKIVSLFAVAAVAVTMTQVQAEGRRAHVAVGDEGAGSTAVWNARCHPIDDDPVRQIDPVVNFNQPLSRHLHVFFGHQDPSETTVADDLSDRSSLADLDNSCVNQDGDNLTPNLHDGGGASDRAIDNSLYWAPVLNDGVCTVDASTTGPGQQHCTNKADAILGIIYYRSGDFSLPKDGGVVDVDTIDQIQPLPTNIEMLAGDPMNDGAETTDYVRYSCLNPDGEDTTTEHRIPAYCPVFKDHDDHTTIVTQLRMIVSFPNCIIHGWPGPDPEHHRTVALQDWNDSDTEDPGEEHMHYDRFVDGVPTCDDGTARDWDIIPQVEFGIRWDVNSAFSDHIVTNPNPPATPLCDFKDDDGDWHHPAQCFNMDSAYLSSDDQSMPGMEGHSGLHGVTGHADFINGWSDPDLTTLMHQAYWHCVDYPTANYGPRRIGRDHNEARYTPICSGS